MALEAHGIHPYPCKFPPEAIADFLPSRGRLLDPYCGSGTTLLEAGVRGLEVVGFDCNQIAVLISRCKLLDISEDAAERVREACADALALSASAPNSHDLPDFHGRDHWFSPVARAEYGLHRFMLDRWHRWSPEWIVYAVAVSSTVNRFSNQDSETRYARVERHVQLGQISQAIAKKLDGIVAALAQRGQLGVDSVERVHEGDIRQGLPVEDESIDVVITSPPYANTMDYYLYHKQRMNVLGLDFKAAQKSEIGSRWEFSSLKAPLEKWNADYLEGLRMIARTLRPGGTAVVIIGDSQVAGQLVDGGRLTLDCGQALGLHGEIVDSIAMAGRSRSFSRSYQAPDKREHVVVLKKEGMGATCR